MKKTALFTAVFLLLSVIVPVPSLSAEQGIIHREIEEMQIARNVVYKTITRFTDLGWDRIHLLEADIADRHTRLDLLTPPGGVGTARTLPEMVKDSDTIGAINGDFFISGEAYSPIGPLLGTARIQCSPYGNRRRNWRFFAGQQESTHYRLLEMGNQTLHRELGIPGFSDKQDKQRICLSGSLY